MADKTAAPTAAPGTDEPIYVLPNEILGAVVRNLQELIAYCMQDARGVEPPVCNAVLERAYGWVQKLPPADPVYLAMLRKELNGSGQKAEEGKRAS